MSTATLEQQAGQTFGEKLQSETIGVELHRQNLKLRRKMTDSQLAKTAMVFQADPKSVSGGRKLLNTKHELVAPVLSLMLEARYYVRDRSIDYPEKGVRLMKVKNVDSMVERIARYKQELAEMLEALDAGWEEIKQEAMERLGELYSEADYAQLPSTYVTIDVSFPAIKPDERLMKINPELYKQEQERIRARFEDAVSKAEAQAAEQVQELLGHFLERMKPDAEGKTKVLRTSTLENIKHFVGMFRETSIGSNQALDALVDKVDQLTGGLDAVDIRKAAPEDRQKITEGFEKLKEIADTLVVDKAGREFTFDD